MAVQGIWSGTISFSLVAIPVRLVTAVSPGRVAFHLLHRKEFSPLVRRMQCSAEGVVVPREETVRGYEFSPDRHVVMTDAELEAVSPERSRTIEIIEFIDLNAVDPVSYDRPYYLVPLKGGEKAYRLLAEVMKRTNRAGLARFVLSEREHLVALTFRDGALALTTLHYADEIVPDRDFSPREAVAGTEEHDRMARSIERMMTDFNPGKYADERKNRISGLLEEAAKKTAAVQAPAMPEGAGEAPPDLVAALEESMRSIKERR